MPDIKTRISLAQARRTMIAAQALQRDSKDDLVKTLEKTGFIRTLGGVEAYLALAARVRGFTAAHVHAALEAGDAAVVPAARGRMYLVARRDVPLALGLAGMVSKGRFEKERVKVGIKEGEVEKLGERIVVALEAKGALSTDALRKALPEGSVRSLGEVGKKAGVSTTLLPATRALELQGRIERTAEGARLDTQRYVWRLPKNRTLRDDTADPIALVTAVAEKFWRAAGLASLKTFAAWSGLSAKDAKEGVDRLQTTELTVESTEGPYLALNEMLDVVHRKAKGEDAVALLPFEDNLFALQGGPRIFVNAAHHGLEVPSWGAAGTYPLGECKHLSYRSAVAEGRMVGFWEYDPVARNVHYTCFDNVEAPTKKRLDQETQTVRKLLADEIGHGRSYSLDSDAELKKRSAWVKELGNRD